jgi:hypothetical protein
MLLFQDGSTHRWIAALGHDLDLVVTLDDATGEIYSALPVDQERTMSSFLGLAEKVSPMRVRPRGVHRFQTGRVDLTVKRTTDVLRNRTTRRVTDSARPLRVARPLRDLSAAEGMIQPTTTAVARYPTPRGREPNSEGDRNARFARHSCSRLVAAGGLATAS